MSKNTTDFEKLKPANQPTAYSNQQLQEFVKCARDPLYFMENYMFIQHPTKGKIPFEAYPFQRDLVKTYWNFRNTAAMIPRQSGKCVVNNTEVVIRDKTSGEIYDLPIGTYYEWAACMRDSKPPPDISGYKRR
jgi:hypothetical protein